LATPTSKDALATYLLVWGIFTGLLFIGTFKINRALQFVFGTLTLLFFLLAIGDYTGNAAITVFAGYEGIICGGSAIYAAIANVLNEVYGRKVLPLG
jgi:succinate-acetate transporter protein